MSKQDKTLLDNNRTDLNLFKNEIDNVLPEYFKEDFPNIKSLFEAYYEFMDSADNPSGQIKRLHSSRDATQVPDKLLQYLEDELLLGQAYFGGFLNKEKLLSFRILFIDLKVLSIVLSSSLEVSLEKIHRYYIQKKIYLKLVLLLIMNRIASIQVDNK